MYFLIAGYNTMSKEEKEKYDIEGIATMALKMWITRLGVVAMLCTAFARAEDVQEDAGDLPLAGDTQPLSFKTNEGSWLTLDASPDGKTLIFDLLGDLYVLPAV